ncbi:oxidoreductase-like domain-containing protein [Phenylobacterium kunshanense]|uniref:oxidoreductase-like domain-containing protein n=1 Tax=Phenylobacterium kunshanense TaxID=1445034 RepID=UPI00197C8429|nr:oxidoreductase-like domain-containing protein [Phenylobacterium kunshanense]
MTQSLPPPPDRPEDYMCCQRGCCPCIFDYYEDAMDRWREKVRALGGDPEALLAARAG